MTTEFLQPAPWLYKGEEPDTPEFAPGDPDGTKTVAGIAFQTDVQIVLRDMEVRQEAKRQHRRKSLESLGEHGWGFSDLRQAYAELADQAQQPDIGQWRRTLSRDEALLHGTDEGDGHGILYSRKVNLIFGPSESGKSMFAFAVAAQEIQAGRHVIIVDFEDDHYGFVGRLKSLGVDIEEMDPNGTKPGGAYYIAARLGMEDDDFKLIRDRIQEHQDTDGRISMVLVDAVTEAMSADGLNPDKAAEVAQWAAAMPKRFAALGPGVLVIDHTNLTDTDRAQGSQHKKSMIDGVALKISKKQSFIRGRGGAAGIYIAKDRIGSVREQSLAAKTGEMEYRGTFAMNPPGEERNEPFAMIGRNPLDLDRPVDDETGSSAPAADVDETIEEVLRVVAANPGAGKDAVRERMEIEARNATKYAAIDEAIRLKLIRAEKGFRGKIECFPILPEEQLEMPGLTSPRIMENGLTSPHDRERSRSTSPHDRERSGEVKGQNAG